MWERRRGMTGEIDRHQTATRGQTKHQRTRGQMVRPAASVGGARQGQRTAADVESSADSDRNGRQREVTDSHEDVMSIHSCVCSSNIVLQTSPNVQ